MVLSMTGYGRAGALLHGRDIKVELRSVNARFFEYSSRLPRSCAFLEDKLKKLVASKVSRGKVELSLSIQTVTEHAACLATRTSMWRGRKPADKIFRFLCFPVFVIITEFPARSFSGVSGRPNKSVPKGTLFR